VARPAQHFFANTFAGTFAEASVLKESYSVQRKLRRAKPAQLAEPAELAERMKMQLVSYKNS